MPTEGFFLLLSLSWVLLPRSSDDDDDNDDVLIVVLTPILFWILTFCLVAGTRRLLLVVRIIPVCVEKQETE